METHGPATKQKKALKKDRIVKSADIVRRVAINRRCAEDTESGDENSCSDHGERTNPSKRRKIYKREKLDKLMVTIENAVSDAARQCTTARLSKKNLSFEKQEAEQPLQFLCDMLRSSSDKGAKMQGFMMSMASVFTRSRTSSDRV